MNEVRENYLKIVHRPERALVAVLGPLAPNNKVEPGFGQYLAKRDTLSRSPVHLIEMDFLVGGRRLPMERALHPGDFDAMVARGDSRPDCDDCAWSIRQPPSTIRVTPPGPAPDIPLGLVSVYATSYERGSRARSIE